MVKFVQSDAVGLPMKRKQVSQACDSCRRRKKRCVHVSESEDLHEAEHQHPLRNQHQHQHQHQIQLHQNNNNNNNNNKRPREDQGPSSYQDQYYQHQHHAQPQPSLPHFIPSADHTVAAHYNPSSHHHLSTNATIGTSVPMAQPSPVLQSQSSVWDPRTRDYTPGIGPSPGAASISSGGGGGGGGGNSIADDVRPHRFISDLSPEGMLIEATSPHSSRDVSMRGGVGVWQSRNHHPVPSPLNTFDNSADSYQNGTVTAATSVPASADDHTQPQRAASMASSPSSSPSESSHHSQNQGQSQTLTSVKAASTMGPHVRLPSIRRSLQEKLRHEVMTQCLTCRPPLADLIALRRIYMNRLDPIFPVLNHPLTEFWMSGSDNHSESSKKATCIVIQQIMCLAAASDPSAAPHLRLTSPASSLSSLPRPAQKEDLPLLSRQDFCASLSAAIQTTLDPLVVNTLIPDRSMLTRILLAFSLYVQPTDSEEADLPALMFGKAVHQMHTLGLHMAMGSNGVGGAKDTPEVEAEEEEVVEELEKGGQPAARKRAQTLFCCIWGLDRLNAALYGRACLLHEDDIGWDLEACFAEQPPVFQLFLRILRLLDQVFLLYKPKRNSIAGKDQEEESLSVVDLPIFEQMVIDSGAVQVSSSYLATLEILYHSVAILSCRIPPRANGSTLPAPGTNSRRSLSADRITSIARHEYSDHDGLSYLGLIPYGISLSLSVAYRKMRYSKLAMYRGRGREAFRTNTELLCGLGDTFWTARTMAAMAEKVLSQLDRATASIALQEGNDVSSASPKGMVSPSQQQQQQQQQQQLQYSGHDQQQQQTYPPTQAATPASSSNGRASVASPEKSPSAAAGTAVDVMGGSSIQHNNQSQHHHHHSHSHSHNQQATPIDLDVFQYFGSDFDLGAVDAVLEGNLDFGASSNWFDLQQVWG